MLNSVICLFRREILRDRFLLEVKRWFADAGDATLRFEYPLNQESVVFDVGGYRGDFAAGVHERYGCKVHLFEPLPHYYRECVERFSRKEAISCHQYGLSSTQGFFEMSDSADASSYLASRATDKLVNVEMRSVVDAVRKFAMPQVDLLKINIEGGEFDILPALIESESIKQVRFIQVQFHNFVPDATTLRKQIRHRLSETHNQMWNYEFVWESWELR